MSSMMYDVGSFPSRANSVSLSFELTIPRCHGQSLSASVGSLVPHGQIKSAPQPNQRDVDKHEGPIVLEAVHGGSDESDDKERMHFL